MDAFISIIRACLSRRRETRVSGDIAHLKKVRLQAGSESSLKLHMISRQGRDATMLPEFTAGLHSISADDSA
jgi:hypothetical protein